MQGATNDVGVTNSEGDVRATKQTSLISAIAAEAVARFTGKPKPGQKPLIDLPGWAWLILDLATLATSIAATIAVLGAMTQAGWSAVVYVPLLALLLITTTGRFRALQVAYGHAAIHNVLFRRRWLNSLGADLVTAIAVCQNPVEYRDDHMAHHRRPTFTTKADPDKALLMKLGFRAGMAEGEVWALLRRTIISPRFHLGFITSRIRSAFVTSSPRHKAMTSIWVAGIGLLATLVPWWMVVVAILTPLFPLYQVSAFLQFATEHSWFAPNSGDPATDNAAYADRSIARFCIEPVPQFRLSESGRWLRFFIRVLFLHVPTRLGVIPTSDLQAHDWHHAGAFLAEQPRQWPNAIFLRRQAVDDKGNDNYGLADGEAHDLIAALRWFVHNVSRAERD